MLLHSRQKRKVICSWVFVGGGAPSAAVGERAEGAGEAMGVGGCRCLLLDLGELRWGLV